MSREQGELRRGSGEFTVLSRYLHWQHASTKQFDVRVWVHAWDCLGGQFRGGVHAGDVDAVLGAVAGDAGAAGDTARMLNLPLADEDHEGIAGRTPWTGK